VVVLGGRDPRDSDGRVFPPLPPPEPEPELELDVVAAMGEVGLRYFDGEGGAGR
jgi:hypothetical protein